MSLVTITRKIEFDAGHRIPDHKSKCRSAHGHRYVLEATATGEVKPTRGESDDGMVLDFGDLKAIMNELIHDQWDHAFLVAVTDTEMQNALNYLPKDTRWVILDFIPTVENMARHAFDVMKPRLVEHDLNLVSVRLYETPNCWADVFSEA